MSTPSTIEDNELVKKIVSGDIDLYEQLILRYEQKLLRYVVYMVLDSDVAADIVQDTFIKAYRNLNGFKPEYKFSSWIFRIAHNESMNVIKRNKYQVVDSDLPDEKEYFYVDSHIEEKIDGNILRDDVRSCMMQLNAKYREILLLHYFQDMKYTDIGRTLHLPTSTVGVRLRRAKHALKTICEKRGITYEN